MLNEKNTALHIFIVFCVTGLCYAASNKEPDPEVGPEAGPEIGRIKAFDDMLLMYGKEINEGKGLEPALEEAKRLANNVKFIKEHADYYIEMLGLVKETRSPKILSQEQQRLNGIITSASYQPDGQLEINYALVRRNILGSFIESAAQHLMNLLEDSPEMAMEKIRKLMKNAGGDNEEEEEVVEIEVDKNRKWEKLVKEL